LKSRIAYFESTGDAVIFAFRAFTTSWHSRRLFLDFSRAMALSQTLRTAERSAVKQERMAGRFEREEDA
jgi:hypothetical protein